MSIGNDEFLKPLMYRDLIGPENSPMGMMYGLGNPFYNTNYLGGVTMPAGLSHDTFSSFTKPKQKDFGFLKKLLLTMGGVTAFCALRGRGSKLVKWFKGSAGKNKPKWISNLFKFKTNKKP